MSHFKQYQGETATADGRVLGDEWADWRGDGGNSSHSGKGLFLSVAAAVIVATDLVVCAAAYLITPRLAMWHRLLPSAIGIVAAVFVIFTAVLFAQLVLTVSSGRKFFLLRGSAYALFDLVFSRAFRFATWAGISRDRLGHSFVLVSNAVSRAQKLRGSEEKLLILLPRCLSKEELKSINELKEKYPVEIHTVSGGELARKKVRELKPTGVIGVACERDLVSGIRDVGRRLSVIGIANQRPEGPCKNTHIDMAELIEAIEFYVGKPRQA